MTKTQKLIRPIIQRPIISKKLVNKNIFKNICVHNDQKTKQNKGPIRGMSLPC